ncbi:MAG: polysaccharide biosynthesis/export family protein, partial [Steroidobacteraceae bacterium]
MTTKSTSILGTLVLAGLLVVPAAASAQTKASGNARTTAAVTNAKPWSTDEYRLGPGDKLRVEVYREAQLSQSLQVRPDGKITLPLVGDFAADGKTPIELRDGLTTLLKEYVTNPVVTVIVVEATAAQVYVIGEVASPGTLVMQGPMTALQALAQVGGLREFADRDDIRILRKTPTGVRTIGFDYKKAVRGETEALFFLQPGDTV